MSARKFRQGDVLDFMGVIKRLLDGEYVYFHHKPMHPAALSNWPFAMLRTRAHYGSFREALPATHDAEPGA